MSATTTGMGQATRTVPMKVLALGMSRTGTMSTKAALEILGYRSYHFVEFVANPPDGDHWNAWLRAKYAAGLNLPPSPLPTRADFDKVLGNFSAVTDMPAILLAEELIAAYPEAKVVLVERDVEKWYNSFNDSIIEVSYSPVYRWVAKLDPYLIKRINDMIVIVTRGYFESATKEKCQAVARQKYEDHNALVKKLVPEENLLLYRMGDGWGPLCDFLDVEKPVGVDFPMCNETEEFRRRVNGYIIKGIGRGLLKLSVVLVPATIVAFSIWKH